MESFFATVKSEEAERFDSHGEAKMALFDFIEVFYAPFSDQSSSGKPVNAAYRRGELDPIWWTV